MGEEGVDTGKRLRYDSSMGVDYHVCRGCGEPYPDCSSRCRFCSEDQGGCGAGFCSAVCAELLNWDVAPFPTYAEERAMTQQQREALLCSCVVCRKTAPEWADLAKFLLRRLGMSETQLRTAFAEEAQVERAEYLAKQRAELWPELLQYLPEKTR